jgi:hypothetical protein
MLAVELVAPAVLPAVALVAPICAGTVVRWTSGVTSNGVEGGATITAVPVLVLRPPGWVTKT